MKRTEFQKLWDHLDTNETVSHTLPPDIDLVKLFDELQVLDAQSHQYDEIAHTIVKECMYDPHRNLHGTICDIIDDNKKLTDELVSYRHDTYLCDECGDPV